MKRLKWFLIGTLISPCWGGVKGFYAGIGLGMGNATTTTRFENHLKESGAHELSPGALYSCLQGGYFYEIKSSQIVFGGEGYVLFNSRKISGDLKIENQPVEGKYRIRVPYGLGITGYLGYRINIKATPFIGGGIENFRINITHSELTYAPSQTQTFKHSFKLLHIDVGGMMKIHERFLAVAVYQYFPDNKIVVRELDKIVSAASRYVHHTLKEHRILIKLNYIF